MRGDTVNVTRFLVTESCCACGIEFAAPREFFNQRREDHKSFWCPNGHGQSYTGKTEAETLKVKLEREKENVEWHRKRAEAAMAAKTTAEHQRDAYKGHNTRLKKRVAKGKCPCCHATFVNLASHMKNRHPDFAVKEEVANEGNPGPTEHR